MLDRLDHPVERLGKLLVRFEDLRRGEPLVERPFGGSMPGAEVDGDDAAVGDGNQHVTQRGRAPGVADDL